METRITSATKEVIISDKLPTVLIGERINPTGKKKLVEELQTGKLNIVRQEALAQIEAGADILDVNIGVTGIDEVALLSRAVQTVMETVDAPLSIDSNNHKALEAAIVQYNGKPLINSVSGEERSLKEVLPIVKEYGTAVIGLTMDEKGIPSDADRRLEIACKILEQAELLGIPREDIIIDSLATTLGADNKTCLMTLETIHKIKMELGVNLTIGSSNISFGIPDRDLLNCAFLSLAIAAGVNCPIVNVFKVRPFIYATDLVLGRDKYARRYTKAYRERRSRRS